GDGLPRVDGRDADVELAFRGVRVTAPETVHDEASAAGRLDAQRAPDHAPVEGDLGDLLEPDGDRAGSREKARLRVLDPVFVDAERLAPGHDEPRLTEDEDHSTGLNTAIPRCPSPAGRCGRGS